jgi:hypothetical protein
MQKLLSSYGAHAAKTTAAPAKPLTLNASPHQPRRTCQSFSFFNFVVWQQWPASPTDFHLIGNTFVQDN